MLNPNSITMRTFGFLLLSCFVFSQLFIITSVESIYPPIDDKALQIHGDELSLNPLESAAYHTKPLRLMHLLIEYQYSENSNSCLKLKMAKKEVNTKANDIKEILKAYEDVEKDQKATVYSADDLEDPFIWIEKLWGSLKNGKFDSSLDEFMHDAYLRKKHFHGQWDMIFTYFKDLHNLAYSKEAKPYNALDDEHLHIHFDAIGLKIEFLPLVDEEALISLETVYAFSKSILHLLKAVQLYVEWQTQVLTYVFFKSMTSSCELAPPNSASNRLLLPPIAAKFEGKNGVIDLSLNKKKTHLSCKKPEEWIGTQNQYKNLQKIQETLFQFLSPERKSASKHLKWESAFFFTNTVLTIFTSEIPETAKMTLNFLLSKLENTSRRYDLMLQYLGEWKEMNRRGKLPKIKKIWGSMDAAGFLFLYDPKDQNFQFTLDPFFSLEKLQEIMHNEESNFIASRDSKTTNIPQVHSRILDISRNYLELQALFIALNIFEHWQKFCDEREKQPLARLRSRFSYLRQNKNAFRRMEEN